MNSEDPKHFTPAESAQIRAALAPCRPDPEAFEAAVRAKLDAAMPGAGSDGSAESADRFDEVDDAPPTDSRLLRAASFVPFLSADAPSQAAGAGTVFSKWSWMSVLAILALPVVTVAMLFITFFVSFWSVHATHTDNAGKLRRPAALEARMRVKAWWAQHFKAALVVAALLLVSLTTRDVTIFLYLMTAAMLAFAWLIALMARWGLATQTRVAATAFWGLFFGVQAMQTLRLWVPGTQSSAFPVEALPLSLGIGAAVCALAPRNRAVPSFVLAAFALLMAALTGGGALRSARPSTEELTARCEQFGRDIFTQTMWREWTLCADWLREEGHTFDTTRAEHLIAAALAGDRDERGDPNTSVIADWLRSGDPAGLEIIRNGERLPAYELSYASRAGLIPDARLVELLDPESYAATSLLDPRSRSHEISSLGQSEWRIRALLATGELGVEEVDHLEHRLHASWPALDGFSNIQSIRLIVMLCDAIGRPLDPETWRASVHDVLRRCWQDHSGFRPGGFSSNIEKLKSSDLHVTHDAVVLMERFGAPPEIDLYRLGAYLDSQARVLFIAPRRHWMQEAAGVALLRLEDRIGYPSRGVFEFILAERMLLGGLLVVVLAVFAIRRAPVEPRSPRTRPTP